MIHVLASIAAGRVNVTFSGGNGTTVTEIDGVSPYDTTVAIRFNSNGTVESGESSNGAALSWTSRGNWIDPTSHITGNEQVRFTNFNGAGGGDWTTEAAADDAWTAISASPTWQMNSTVAEEINFTCDFEVRDTTRSAATGSSSWGFDIQNTA